MTTEEYLIARKSPDWRFNTVVPKDSFNHVNRIHPIMQADVSKIVQAAREDKAVKRLIIFGSSIRYDCDITSDLDICIDWLYPCYDSEGVLMPFTKNMREIIARITKGNADVVNYESLKDTILEDAVEKGVIVYEHNV